MATKIPVAQQRMFTNVFVCKKCCHKIRTDPVRILNGKVKCRKCGSRAFRQIKKK